MSETASKPKRRNLTLPDSSIARIASIRERTEAASDSEVVRRALRLYESLLKAEATVHDKDGKSFPIGML
jgi:Arc/MetJ-type ribon-helix-helix transcriptional regulator